MASADSLLVAAATSPTAPAASSPLEALYDAQQQAVLRPLPAPAEGRVQQPVTVWVPPPWIVVLPLLVAVYLHFFLPQSAAVSMTAEQLEFALTGMNFHDYLSYKNGRDSVAASGLASAGGLLTSFQYGTSFAPL
jgi:hypothetical protein